MARLAWTIEERARNIHAIRVELPRVGDEAWGLLQSDVHWDNPKCDRDTLKEHLDEAADRGAFILDNGDWFCAMQGKWDKRANKSDLRPEHQSATYLDALVDTSAEYLAPYAPYLGVRGFGNHETGILKRHETHLTERLVERIKAKHPKSPVKLGGYGGWIVIEVRYGGTRIHPFKLHYHHGHGGGGPVTRGVIQTNRMAVYLADADIVWTGHCFSDDTEILTPTGWVKHDQLVPGSVVATMNKQTKRLEYQPAESVHRYDDYTELHHIQANGVDLLVTDKHGLCFWHRKTHAYGECTAADFHRQSNVTMLCSAEDGAAPLDGFTDDDLRLLVWIVADGHIEGPSVRFHLKKPRKIERLKALLDRMGIRYTVGAVSKRGTVKIRTAGADSERVLRGLVGGEKCLPPWLYGVNGAQAACVLQEYEATDGSTWGVGRGGVFYSADTRNVDILQALCVKAGRRSTMAQNQDRTWRLNASLKPGVFFARGRSSVVPYRGTVWCVSVPNGTLIVRRNGRVTVTQNTHDSWQVPIPRVKLNQNNTAVQHIRQVHVRTAGYKEEYSDGYGGWHVERGGAPKPVSAAWLRLSYTKRLTVEFEITEAR